MRFYSMVWPSKRSHCLLAVVVGSVFLPCLASVGCTPEGYQYAPVSGKVTLAGAPVANVLVSFQPQGGGPGSTAVTGADGTFSLGTVAESSRPGAVVGTHVVNLTELGPETDEEDDSGGAPVEYKLPANARDGSMTFTVPAEGTDQANFEF